MKVRFVMVTPDLLPPVRAEVAELVRAMDAADLSGMDAATERLLALTAACPAVDLSEAAWRTFLAAARSSHPDFESSYLLPGGVCTAIFPAVGVDDQVLELPIDDGLGEEASDV